MIVFSGRPGLAPEEFARGIQQVLRRDYPEEEGFRHDLHFGDNSGEGRLQAFYQPLARVSVERGTGWGLAVYFHGNDRDPGWLRLAVRDRIPALLKSRRRAVKGSFFLGIGVGILFVAGTYLLPSMEEYRRVDLVMIPGVAIGSFMAAWASLLVLSVPFRVIAWNRMDRDVVCVAGNLVQEWADRPGLKRRWSPLAKWGLMHLVSAIGLLVAVGSGIGILLGTLGVIALLWALVSGLLFSTHLLDVVE